MTATVTLWQAAGQPAGEGSDAGVCRVCGEPGVGLDFEQWVRPTFTDWDKLQAGNILCHACQFAFVEASPLLTARTGKEKLQRMRNYSHLVVNGAWYPLSKGQKDEMRRILFSGVPELVVIAESGQKHIIFRARVNLPGCTTGYIQFEEQGVYYRPAELEALTGRVTELLNGGFNKEEIETGQYRGDRIMRYGPEVWQGIENRIKPERGGLRLRLAVFLAQKEETDGIDTGTTSGAVVDSLERNFTGLQEQVPPQHLAAVRGPDQERGLHEQREQVRQLALF